MSRLEDFSEVACDEEIEKNFSLEQSRSLSVLQKILEEIEILQQEGKSPIKKDWKQ